MNCPKCQSTIVDNSDHQNSKNKYIKLFREVFPKKPIELNSCKNCYNMIIKELENEYQSKINHNSLIDDRLNEKKESKKINRYSILDEESPEYLKIKERFNETLSYPIIRIERNNNPKLEKKFQERSKKLHCQNIKYLFHGSNNKAYDNILEKGFDLEYASPNGLLGKGIYYAHDANYSHNYGRLTKTNIGKINHLLYCKVNLGKTRQGTTGLLEAPIGYDAVHSTNNTYCVFDNYQGIPEYIIYYMVE
jgi:hypothetical protein